MPVTVYIIMGGRNTRKSSCIRALTGMGRKGVCQVELANGNIIDLFVRVSSLQESRITPNAFVNEVRKGKYENVLVPLWVESRKHPHQSGNAYLSAFINANWQIERIEVLGRTALPYPVPLAPPALNFIPNSTARPSNRNGVDIRQRWGWL